jgi:hypothetical protein
MFFPLHISSSRVEISFHTEFELPRPAENTILVVNPIFDRSWDWLGWSGALSFLFLSLCLEMRNRQHAHIFGLVRTCACSDWALFFFGCLTFYPL